MTLRKVREAAGLQSVPRPAEPALAAARCSIVVRWRRLGGRRCYSGATAQGRELLRTHHPGWRFRARKLFQVDVSPQQWTRERSAPLGLQAWLFVVGDALR